MELSRGTIRLADDEAARGASVDRVLDRLRGLAMEEFGELLMQLPDDAYPGLTKMFPAMAPDQVQKTWTGSSGHTLMRQSASFARTLEVAYASVRGESLRGKTILDFGVGWGRLLRLMYYYSNPDRLWGVDAWDRSLAACREAGVLGNLRRSDSEPRVLPVDGTEFDLAYAFSVFTHLPPKTAEACCAAIRSAMKPGGVLVATVRPVEFWAFLDKQRGLDTAASLVPAHELEGHAYLPHAGPEGDTYGDASYSLDWFRKQPGWRLVGYDWSRVDTYQVPVILEAVEIVRPEPEGFDANHY